MSRRRIAAALLCSLLFLNLPASARQQVASAQAPPAQAAVSTTPSLLPDRHAVRATGVSRVPASRVSRLATEWGRSGPARSAKSGSR